MVFFACIFLKIADAPAAAIVRGVFGSSGITAHRTADHKERLVTYKTAVGTADRREKPPAFGTVL